MLSASRQAASHDLIEREPKNISWPGDPFRALEDATRE
jgi:hypothetical protein